MNFYNITCVVENPEVERWLQWIKNEGIPNALKNSNFTNARIFRVWVTDSEHTTFSVQFRAKNREDIARFHQHTELIFRQECHAIFKDSVLMFSTEIEEINP